MPTLKRVRLTEAIIYRAMRDPPPPSAPYLWDSDVPGFAVRINPTGKAIYTFRRAKLWTVIPYADRLEVKRRGEWDRVKDLGLHAARREALRLMGEAHHAPMAASLTIKRRKQAAEGQDAPPTDIEQVFRGFCIDHLQTRTTIRFTRECESRFRRFVLPKWKGRDVRSITRKDVRELVQGIARQGLPYPANRTLSQLSMMFDWCAEQGLLDENQPNPAKGVKKPGVERERTNVLTDQELALIWHAVVHLGYPWGDWFRLLCLLPNRPIAEVALMQWVEINRDKASWTVPRERSKNRRAHIVPLSEPALDVLDSILQRCASVFTTGRPGRDGKPGPIMDYRHAKQLIDRWLAGRIEPIRKWIIYDLRRSIATKLVEDLRVRPEVVETCLNHTLPGVLFKHYAHVAFLDEKREALDKWAQHLLQLAEHYKPAPTEEELRTRALLRDAKKHLRAKSLVEANAIALGLDKPARRSRRT